MSKISVNKGYRDLRIKGNTIYSYSIMYYHDSNFKG